jgi:hypothetical protein
VTARDLVRPIVIGRTLFGGVLALFLVRLTRGATEPEARAVVFVALSIGQTLLVLAERSPDRPLWRASLAGNRALPAIGATVFAGPLAAPYLPFRSSLLKVAPLPLSDWAIVGVVALATTTWAELENRRRLSGHSSRKTPGDP